MARRRVKKRTHAGANPTPGAGTTSAKPGERVPKSMVIRIGASDVGPSVSQLVSDVRSMMEPNTAARLKERRNNKLRDYTTMAGPLGVSHLMLFSRSESGNTNLRLAVTPRGPTLHFRVEKYSLCKDVAKSMKRPKSGGAEYLTAPLLVMNNFAQATATADKAQKEGAADGSSKTNPIPKQLESLTTTIFQSLFAPISPQSTSLKTIKRVLLLDRVPHKPTADNPEENHEFVLQLRHFAISSHTPKSSLPKALRRLEAAERLRHGDSRTNRLPNLGRLDDVADYLLDPAATQAFTSASESEADTDAEVEVLASDSRRVMNKEERQRMRDAQRARILASENAAAAAAGDGEAAAPVRPPPRAARTEKKAIKLQELGPRMTLRLTKVEEGLCGGKVMWHEYISKSRGEEKEMDKVWEQRRKEKEERRKIQRENVERKKKDKKASGKGDEEDDDEDEDMADWSDDEWHDEDAAQQGMDVDDDQDEDDDDDDEEEEDDE